MDTPTGKTALIFGASGITGHPIARLCLSYPTSTTFSRVIGLNARPLTIAEAGLPADTRLELYSGLDLSKDEESTRKFLEGIEGIGKVTNVYFAGELSSIFVVGRGMKATRDETFTISLIVARDGRIADL